MGARRTRGDEYLKAHAQWAAEFRLALRDYCWERFWDPTTYSGILQASRRLDLSFEALDIVLSGGPIGSALAHRVADALLRHASRPRPVTATGYA